MYFLIPQVMRNSNGSVTTVLASLRQKTKDLWWVLKNIWFIYKYLYTSWASVEDEQHALLAASLLHQLRFPQDSLHPKSAFSQFSILLRYDPVLRRRNKSEPIRFLYTSTPVSPYQSSRPRQDRTMSMPPKDSPFRTSQIYLWEIFLQYCVINSIYMLLQQKNCLQSGLY